MPELTEVDKPQVAEAKPEISESSTESDTDDEIPELEDAGTGGASGNAAFPGAAAAAGLPIPIDISKAKQSRGEKKARKIMSKLGLKPVRFIFSHILRPPIFNAVTRLTWLVPKCYCVFLIAQNL